MEIKAGFLLRAMREESFPGLSPWLIDGHLLSVFVYGLPSVLVSVSTFPLLIRTFSILDLTDSNGLVLTYLPLKRLNL